MTRPASQGWEPPSGRRKLWRRPLPDGTYEYRETPPAGREAAAKPAPGAGGPHPEDDPEDVERVLAHHKAKTGKEEAAAVERIKAHHAKKQAAGAGGPHPSELSGPALVAVIKAKLPAGWEGNDPYLDPAREEGVKERLRSDVAALSPSDLFDLIRAHAAAPGTGGLKDYAAAAAERLAAVALEPLGYDYDGNRAVYDHSDGRHLINVKVQAGGSPVAKWERADAAAFADLYPEMTRRRQVFARLYFAVGGPADGSRRGVFLYANGDAGKPRLDAGANGDGVTAPVMLLSYDEFERLARTDPAELGRRVHAAVSSPRLKRRFQEVMAASQASRVTDAIRRTGSLIEQAEELGVRDQAVKELAANLPDEAKKEIAADLSDEVLEALLAARRAKKKPPA